MDIISSAMAGGKLVGGLATTIAKAFDFFNRNVAAHVNNTSMIGVSSLVRAEPLTIVSNDCANLEYMPDIMNTLTSLYSAYYLQTAAILGKANSIEVVKILDSLNPNRDSTGFLLQGRLATMGETIDNGKFSLPLERVLAAEAEGDRPSKGDIDSVNKSAIYEASNLAVGKVLNVDIAFTNEEGCTKSVVLPVSVRLSPSILPVETISYIFTHRNQDISLTESYYAWRAGRRSAIADGIFAQNLINEYRKAAIMDRSGTLQEIIRRATNARSYGALTNNASLAISSNLYVLSKAASLEIEHKTGKKFSSAVDRMKMLDGTYAMIIVVIDPDKEMVDFYFNGIEAPSRISVRSLKFSGKGKDGVDISDVLKSLLNNQTPTF